MSHGSHRLAVYLNLARASQRRQRPLVRDRMLVLAGIQAARMNLFQLSQYCRSLILNHNSNHFVGRWNSIAEGLRDDEFVSLSDSVARKYPLERAEQLLESLGLDISNEQATYDDDVEYAAAILDVDPGVISDAQDEGPEH